MSDVTLKLDGLNKFIKALKNNSGVKVGILGQHDVREGQRHSNVSNSFLGAAHEFGTSSIPQRSFLRIPILKNLESELADSGMFDKEALGQVFKQKSLDPWLEKMGILGVGIVLDAFDQQGPGWKPVTEETMRRKKVKQILTETQQLRDSITYELE